MQPGPDEQICPISYEIAHIRVGGTPEARPGFWKAYREEYALNQRTKYKNQHVDICRRLLLPLEGRLHEKFYFRSGKLVTEKQAT